MGDETRELLRNETADYERSSRAPASTSTPDIAHDSLARHRAAPSSASSRVPASPLGHSLERRAGRRAATPRLSASPASARFGASDKSLLSSPERHRYDSLSHLSVHAHSPARRAETRPHADAGPDAKRRRLEPDSSQFPELDLEIDVDFDIYLNDVLRDPLSEQSDMPHLRQKGGDSAAAFGRLEAPVSSDAASPSVEALQSQVGTLKNLLATKQEDIEALQAELNEREEKHQIEIRKIKQDMHREYSKQASEKLRVIIKRLELSAKKQAEQDWKDRVAKLSEVVEHERSEKAELVQACDEYLRLKGF